MPFSSEHGKSFVQWVVNRVPHQTKLDIGCGSGTYAKLFPGGEWTGVEVWKPYVDQYNLMDLYQNLCIEDARDWQPAAGQTFDVAFAGDVLEHMSLDEAKTLLAKLRECATTVIVSVPLGHYPQEAYAGNPYEKHVLDDLTQEQVIEAFGVPTIYRVDQEIGVFVYSKLDIRLKIAVYAISKNEEQFVERFCKSAADADAIVIADTGSTDRTVGIARANGATVHNIWINPWRFDKAREAALALVPRDIDVCISLDLDEVMEPGWREEIERVWTPETTRLRYKFDWGMNILFFYEKIHARNGYWWHHPCHEYPRPDLRTNEVYAHTDKLLVRHLPDPTKSRGQYLDLLAVSVKEDPSCPRNAFYYARELTFHRRWHDAIYELKRYLALPGATWPNERCYAMRLLGQAHEELQQDGLLWFRMACMEAPGTREPWVDLAMTHYRRHQWQECYLAATSALAITNRELVYTCDPEVWTGKPHDLAAIAAYHLGQKDRAVAHGTTALELEPGNERYRANLAYYES